MTEDAAARFSWQDAPKDAPKGGPATPATATTDAYKHPSGRTLLGASHRAPPKSSFPLGMKSHVPVLGANAGRDMYTKTRHVTSSKFSNSFDPDHWF